MFFRPRMTDNGPDHRAPLPALPSWQAGLFLCSWTGAALGRHQRGGATGWAARLALGGHSAENTVHEIVLGATICSPLPENTIRFEKRGNPVWLVGSNLLFALGRNSTAMRKPSPGCVQSW